MVTVAKVGPERADMVAWARSPVPRCGVVEAHFHFFVMIGVITLYQARGRNRHVPAS
jgi:predicted membrane channel-forming protein YqfA (hemolysin III family)